MRNDLEQALADPAIASSPDAVARLRLALVGVLYLVEHDVEEAGRVLDVALVGGEDGVDTRTWLELLNYRGFLFASRGQLVAAVEPLVAAMSGSIQAREARSAAQATVNLAETLAAMGSAGAALRVLDRAPAWVWQSRRSHVERAWIRFRALIDDQRHDEAKSEIAMVRETVGAMGDDPRAQLVLRTMEAQLHHVEGRHGLAVDQLEPLCDSALEQSERLYVAWVAASAALAAGDLEAAERLGDRALALCDPFDTALDQAVHVLASDIARAVGEPGRAFELLRQAAQGRARRLRELADGSVLTYAERHLAAAERRDADRESTIEALRRTQTAAERAQLSAEAATAQLRQITDTLPIQIGHVDRHGHLRFANAALVAAFSHRRERVLGERMEDLLAGPSYERFREGLRQALAGVPSRHTMPIEIGGVMRDIEATWLPAEGSRTGDVYVLAADVTDRTERERQVLRTQKLESLGVLASGLAHDFNNLLTGVVANIELAERDIDSASARAALDDALLAANHASELTRQLQAYAGQASLRRQPMDLNQVVEDAWVLTRAGIGRRVRVSLRLDPTQPHALGDAAQIGQVCVNLLLNATEALAGSDSQVIVRTGTLRHGGGPLQDGHPDPELPAGRYVWFDVEDTGEGLRPDRLQRIFEPFYTTRAPGRGLGLAACLGIVRSHEGRLQVRSTEGVGTTMRVLLPRCEPVVSPIMEPARPGEVDGRILVVDDELLVRRLLTRMLANRGVDVAVAENGDQALRHIAAHPVDLVFLDLTMPVKDGVETLHELRATSAVPVVIMSGYSESDTAHLRESGQIQGFLPKPFTLDTVLRVVGDLLG